MTSNTRTSREIERDVQETRDRIAGHLEEIRGRMTVGRILDEAMDYARHSGGGEMAQNLGRSVRDNPAPLFLIGAGMAWMMASNGVGRRNAGSANTASASAQDAADSMSEATSSFKNRTGDAAARARDTLASKAEDAVAAMHDIKDAGKRGSEAVYRNAGDLANTLSRLFQEQPLVLGALGVALGAALGAAIPESETEDRLMGRQADKLKAKARETAAGQAEHYGEKAKAAMGKTGSAPKQRDPAGRAAPQRTAAQAPSTPSAVAKKKEAGLAAASAGEKRHTPGRGGIDQTGEKPVTVPGKVTNP